jgi:2-polyprenyl-6-methoxyphenol hydroxylase-like FAD-dependent oxidoreductase
LTVATNGLDALRALGADEPIRAAGFATGWVRLYSDRGKRLGVLPLGGADPNGLTTQTIKRARLHDALRAEAGRRGIEIGFGKHLTETEESDEGVVARFADGSEQAADVLIAADGIHSTIRQKIDPTAPTPRYVGLVNFGGYTRDASTGSPPGVWHMIFGRRAFFGSVEDPSGGTVWFANVPRPAVSERERADTRWVNGSSSRSCSRVTRLRLGSITAGSLELAGDNTPTSAPCRPGTTGSMIIIGDAAHAPAPTSGQGASITWRTA